MPLRLLLACALAVGLSAEARADCFRSVLPAGSWSAPATWERNTDPGCPGAGTFSVAVTETPGSSGRVDDVVEVVDGDAVTYATTGVTIAALTVTDGSVAFDNGAARMLTVSGDVTVAAAGVFEVPTSGGAAAHFLTIGGSLANAGVFDMRGGATQTCEVAFTRDGSATVSGAGTTTFDRLVVNLGGVGGSVANTLDVTAVITTASAGSNVVAIANGTLRIASASTVTASGLGDYTLDGNAGLTVANPGATVSFAAALESSGPVTVSAGTLAVGEEFEQTNDSGGPDQEHLTLSGGTMRVATAGAAGNAGTSTFWVKSGTSFTMSGGALVVENGNTSGAASAEAFQSSVASSRMAVTGGTITLGSGAGTAGTFQINVSSSSGSLHNFEIDTDGIEARSISDLTLTGDLVQTSGSLVMDTAGDVLTTSDPAGLGAATTTQSVADSGAGWAMLAPPRAGMTVDDLKGQNTTAGFPGAHYPSDATNLLTGWDGAAWSAPTGTAEALTPGEGFIWYFYAPGPPPLDGYQDLPFDLAATCGGAPCSGTVSDPVVTLNAATEYTLLGSPFGYATTLTDLVGVGADVPNVGSIWNDGAGDPADGAAASTTGSYVLTTTNADRVGVWQGVFLDNPDGATAVVIPNLAKSDAATTFYRRRAARFLQLTLEGHDAASGTRTWDEAAVLYLSPEAADGWDAWDARKLTPLAGTYATLAFVGSRDGEATLKAQESRPDDLSAPLELPLAVTRRGIGGTFELRWPTLDALPAGWAVSLYDTEADVEVDLRAQDAYAFAPGSAARPAAPAVALAPAPLAADEPPRFLLRIDPSGATARDAPDGPEVGLSLAPAFPNPFRDGTTLRYVVDAPGPVRLAVVDVLGREVAVLADGEQAAGARSARWEAAGVASGIYVVRLEAGGRVVSRTVTVQR